MYDKAAQDEYVKKKECAYESHPGIKQHNVRIHNTIADMQ
jgi:hypothetical protein